MGSRPSQAARVLVFAAPLHSGKKRRGPGREGGCGGDPSPVPLPESGRCLSSIGYFHPDVINGKATEGVRTAITHEVKLKDNPFAKGLGNHRDPVRNVTFIQGIHAERRLGSELDLICRAQEANHRGVP